METYDPDRLARLAEEYRRKAEQAETFEEKRFYREWAARYEALVQASLCVAPVTEPDSAKRRRRTDSRKADRSNVTKLTLRKCESP